MKGAHPLHNPKFKSRRVLKPSLHHVLRVASPKDLVWRRGRDLNPRQGFWPCDGLANRCLRPLGHLSTSAFRLNYRETFQRSNRKPLILPQSSESPQELFDGKRTTAWGNTKRRDGHAPLGGFSDDLSGSSSSMPEMANELRDGKREGEREKRGGCGCSGRHSSGFGRTPGFRQGRGCRARTWLVTNLNMSRA